MSICDDCTVADNLAEAMKKLSKLEDKSPRAITYVDTEVWPGAFYREALA